MIYFVDIDDTICKMPKDYLCDTSAHLDYSKAIPIPDRIGKINRLYDENNTIIYWTARGTISGKTWFNTTYSQLTEWGAKFHELRMGKPYYDIFIDDKNINSEVFFEKN